MPVISGLQTSLVGHANTAFAMTFFPRYQKGVWQRLCGTTKSNRAVEPFALNGAAPLMRKYNGTLVSQPRNSWKLNVPNELFKNYEEYKRSEFEFDQTRTIAQSIGALGARVAVAPDYLLAQKILTGSTSGSQTVIFEGSSYTMTFDAQPIFSASHPLGSGNQSNILQGHLPLAKTSITGQDLAVTANQFHEDMTTLIDAISSVTDDKGALLYPDFDPETQLTIAVPPILYPGATLALKTKGTVGGSNGSSSGSTTNIGWTMIKDLISWPLLAGCEDITAESPGTTVTPVNATDYYAFIEGDYVKPWYYQRFMPIAKGETSPNGDDPMAQATRILNEAPSLGLKVSPEAADVYAATEIDHNFGALGASAQASVVEGEKFFASARTRMNILAGPWPTCWRIKPVSGS